MCTVKEVKQVTLAAGGWIVGLGHEYRMSACYAASRAVADHDGSETPPQACHTTAVPKRLLVRPPVTVCAPPTTQHFWQNCGTVRDAIISRRPERGAGRAIAAAKFKVEPEVKVALSDTAAFVETQKFYQIGRGYA